MIEDDDLRSYMDHWFDHYRSNGDKHYSDTPEWKIIELYWDMALDRVMNELPEMTDEENEQIVKRIEKLY